MSPVLSRALLVAALGSTVAALPAALPALAIGETARPLARTTSAGVLAATMPISWATVPRATSDLPDLERQLSEAAALARTRAGELTQAAARGGQLRVAVERLEQAQEHAQDVLDARVRRAYMAQVALVPMWATGVPADRLDPRRLAVRGVTAAVQVDDELLQAAEQQTAAAAALREQAEQLRAQLIGQAQAALAAQDRAQELLAVARVRLAEQQRQAEQRAAVARAEADRQAAMREQQRLASAAARLEQARAMLLTTSATVTTALTPAQTRRSQRAARDQGPVLALVEVAGSGYPAGYRPTGQVLSGPASWYGPGFVGSPTASGAPYDPERLTCAHKSLPLGTVVRVSAGGRAVSCLVTDRGPYVGPRILDMSRAGSRALGYDGVAQVVIEVLAPAGLSAG